MKKIISAIISKFSDDYYNSSRKMKIVLIASVAIASAVVVGMLFRSCSSSLTSTHRRLALAALSATDENGDKWTLDLLKGQPPSRFRSGTAKPGPPLLVKTDVRTRGRNVSIGLVVEGQAGEKYVGGAKKNAEQMPPPKFKIVDEAGKVLATGKFRYG